MAYRYIDLEHDTPCPYCGTMVPEGGCVCDSCGSSHVARYRPLVTSIVFFIFGWWLGIEIYTPATLLIAFGTAIGGAVAAKAYANKNPKWRKGTW